MTKTLIAAAFLLAAGGGAALAASSAPAMRHQQMTQPQPQATQPYPIYHDSPTASWYSPSTTKMPCHFDPVFVEGKMRQVEICN